MPKYLFSPNPKNGKFSRIFRLYHYLKNFLSPKYCLICFNQSNFYLCQNCLQDQNFKINFYCFECEKRIVKKCPITHHSHLIKGLISFSDYENENLKDLIILGKERAFEIFNDFGFYISQYLKKFDLKDHSLVPVPLSRKKLLKRGYNQAEILAKKISQETGLNLSLCLIKIKETPDQVGLSYEERLKNLKGAFKIVNEAPKKIILIDDVKTTGTTLRECAKVLKKAGARKIYALTILR